MIVHWLALTESIDCRAYTAVRRHLPADKYWIVIQEAFSPGSFVNFMPSPEYQNVFLDMHVYQCFGDDEKDLTIDEHLELSCGKKKDEKTHQTLPSFTGEFSVAIEMVRSYTSLSKTKQREFQRKFFLAQTYASELSPPGRWNFFVGWLTGVEGVGTFFWNFKTENSHMWSYFTGLEQGWIPCFRPSTENQNGCDYRNNPSDCNTSIFTQISDNCHSDSMSWNILHSALNSRCCNHCYYCNHFNATHWVHYEFFCIHIFSIKHSIYRWHAWHRIYRWHAWHWI